MQGDYPLDEIVLEVEPEGLRGRRLVNIACCAGFHILSHDVGSFSILTGWGGNKGEMGSQLKFCSQSMDLNPEHPAFHDGLM